MKYIAEGTPRWIIPLIGLSYPTTITLLAMYFLGFQGIIRPYLVLFMVISIALTLMMLFFRDPERKIGEGIVSPADGRVIYTGKSPMRWCNEINNINNYNMVSIFMNIHNVHVNRAPIGGIVKRIRYIKGGHTLAFNKDSDQNERAIITIENPKARIHVVLIAGAFARRIVLYIKEGQRIEKGQRISLIRFGSRVDTHLPKNFKICVKTGEKTVAGETKLAEWKKPKTISYPAF